MKFNKSKLKPTKTTNFWAQKFNQEVDEVTFKNIKGYGSCYWVQKPQNTQIGIGFNKNIYENTKKHTIWAQILITKKEKLNKVNLE